MNMLPADGGGPEKRLAPSGTFKGTRRSELDSAPAQIPVLTQVLSIVRRRKWIVIGTTVGAILIGLLATLLMTPQYTAEATLEIQRETGSFVKVEGAAQKDNVVDQEFYQTQYGLLQSQSLAERVATDLRLQDNRQFFEMFGVKPDDVFGKPGGKAVSRADRARAAGGLLLAHFVVRPERLSRLVNITFTSPDPDLSKRVVDAWSADFVKVTLERRFDTTAYARNFLEGRLAQLRTRIDESQRRLVDYASREGIVNLPATAGTAGGPGTPERSLAADDLSALNQELAQATADRIKAESRLSGQGGAVVEALSNPAINSLRQKRAEVAADYARMLVQFEPGYPPAKALKSQRDQLDQSIAREEARVQGSLTQNYQASVQRERAVSDRVGSLKTGVLDLRRRSIQYDIYQRDVDTNQQLYDALLQRYKEIGVAGGVGVNNISVVDAADRPQYPSSPHMKINLALATLAGLLIGAGIAFLFERIDQGIADPSEVEAHLGVPLLGTIPKVSSGDPIEALRDIKSPMSEAYISLQTNLSFSTDHGIARSLAVTSSRPAEGKSTTTYALAHLLARQRRRVILIDADMRSPSIHHLVNLKNEAGLSNYLAGDDAVHAMIHTTGTEMLSVLTAGHHPPSAPELLSSGRLAQLIQTLSLDYDHIVFDAPPVMGLADAPLIVSKVEGTIFVVESHATQRGVASVAIDRLISTNANVLGVVLTKFDPKRAHYGYGYDYGYGYGSNAESGPDSEKAGR
ncbi:GumC family protein [Sphingomonas faeni]|uniref:GumC family protein n=1 Tax=Sphingomonas faeni TaxID=185950 RepID=UPI0033652AAE